MLPVTLPVSSHTSPEYARWFERQHSINRLVILSIDLKLSDFQSSSITLSITLCIVVTITKLKRWKTLKDSHSGSWSTQLAFGKWSFKIKSYDLCELNARPLVTEFSFWIEFVDQRKWSSESIFIEKVHKFSSVGMHGVCCISIASHKMIIMQDHTIKHSPGFCQGAFAIWWYFWLFSI